MNEKILECTSRIEKELKRFKNRLHIDDLLLKMESNVEVRKLKAEIDEKIKKVVDEAKEKAQADADVSLQFQV